MKFAVAILSAFLGLAESSTASFQPYRISLDRLSNDKSPSTQQGLLEALTDVGMVSVTGVDFKTNRQDLFASLLGCAAKSKATQEHIFKDGTRRLTMATHTLPGAGGIQVIHHESEDLVCNDFSASSDLFRQEVAQVTVAFADRLTSIFQGSTKNPQDTAALLSTEAGHAFRTIADVVENGEHLEHFHSYQRPDSSTLNVQTQDGTIEWHTDQGLFIVFTPARLIQAGKTEVMTEGFSIELKDGTHTQVQFQDQDDLVIMLGDGVNQYINSKAALLLRATPHAVQVPDLVDSYESRVWYGRMVLPPSSAIHPDHGLTFGEIRDRTITSMADSSDDELEDIAFLGCSSASQQARQLEGEACAADTLLCWHRCMSVAEQNVSASICEDQGLDLACINPRSQLWTGLHGDYYPACIDTTTAENHTEYPLLGGESRNVEACTADAYEAFCSSEGYDFEKDLGSGAVLMWSVTDEQKIRGRLTFNGLFGWMSIGFPSLDGKRNGMHGGKVLLAIPGGDYSPVTGLDLSMDYSVKEYIIDPTDASFRHWDEPLGEPSSPERHLVEETDCFTAMTFELDSILDQAFTLDGTDRMIWAANSKDTFVGYHSARGHVNVTWAEGKALNEGEEAPLDESVEDTSGSAQTQFMSWIAAGVAVMFHFAL